MIGLDTNVLVRYIVQDDTDQAAHAGDLIEQRCTVTSPGWISSIVIRGLVWVFEGAYDYSRDVIASVLRQILVTAELSVDSPQLCWIALRAYEHSGADFADYLIGAGNREAGCETTFTFDKRAAHSDWHTPAE